MSSSKKVHVTAPAKTNLWLRVGARREDGFHEIETRMVHLSLADELVLQWTKGNKLEFSCSDDSLPRGEENLAVKAVRALEKKTSRKFGLRVHLEKRIPSGAGLGGGSSDAAAVLKAVNGMGKFKLLPEQLFKLAASIGSDVPFFVFDDPCDVSGRGEVVKPAPKEEVPRLPVVLLKPNFAVSASWAYQKLGEARKRDDPRQVPQICPWGVMENDLEAPVFLKFPILEQMKEWLLQQPEVHAALLSGSGSVVYAVLRHFDLGVPLVKRAKEFFGKETWCYRGSTL